MYDVIYNIRLNLFNFDYIANSSEKKEVPIAKNRHFSHQELYIQEVKALYLGGKKIFTIYKKYHQQFHQFHDCYLISSEDFPSNLCIF